MNAISLDFFQNRRLKRGLIYFTELIKNADIGVSEVED